MGVHYSMWECNNNSVSENMYILLLLFIASCSGQTEGQLYIV